MPLPPFCRHSSGPVDPAARAAWSRVARQYAEHCRREVNWNKMIEIPAMRRMLGEVAGKRCLEVGCGTAHYSIWLAQQGAEVFALDPAEGMVALAREAAEQAGVTLDLRVGGVELLPEYPAASFDLVLFPMMLEYVDDLASTFAAAARLLRPDGCVAISTVHPARHFSVKITAEDGRSARLVRDYLRGGVLEWWGWVMREEDGTEILCKSRRRSVQEYVGALVSAGLLVEALLEPEAIPECRELAPNIWESNADCPQFLLMKAVKDPRKRAGGGREEVADGRVPRS